MNNTKLSVVVPVFKEADNIPVFVERVTPILESVTPDYEIIFALDPSPDASAEMILEENRKNKRIKCLQFSRRFGQPMATLAGMQYSIGDAVIVMDVDLQDPPEVIPEMVTKWREGFDVVYGQRKNREGETFIYRLVTFLGYKLITRMADGVNIPRNTGDFRLMSRRVVGEVLRLKESHGFLRGLVALVGFRQTSVTFVRPKRAIGKGNYNRFFGSLRIGLNGLICFSSYPLSLTTLFGFAIAIFSFIVAVLYAIAKIRGFPFPIGNPTIVILILLFSGVQLISVGVLGEYIGRIYDEVKERPRFIVAQATGFDSPFPDPKIKQ